MPRNGNRQYDPAAAAALSAIDATERSVRSVERQTGGPELPAQSDAFDGVRNAIMTVSDYSPLNMLAGSDGPSLPEPPAGGEMLPENAPRPDRMLPEGVPSPMQFLPAALRPDSGRSRRSPPSNGNGDSNGSKNGNGNGNSGSASRGSTAPARGRGVSR